ncbi:MAG TPA: hypothetical protein VFB41_10900 [Solirubrobacteraceae bacterium]|nr:hypothetical protein [Solirubrobacteraceae bacterium]
MRKWVLVAYLGGLVAVIAVAAAWALKDRDFPASTAQPPPLFTAPTIPIKPGQAACSNDITVESHSRQMRFQVGTMGKPGPELELTLRWPGAVQRRTQAGGYADNAVLGAEFDPPSEPRLATVCFSNRGRVPAYLFAADGTRPVGREVFGGDVSRSTTTVDGRRIAANVVLSFYEAKPTSILARTSATASRIAVFRPVGTWFVWLLGALFVIGIPAGLAWALLRAAGDDDRV